MFPVAAQWAQLLRPSDVTVVGKFEVPVMSIMSILQFYSILESSSNFFSVIFKLFIFYVFILHCLYFTLLIYVF
jgi:hypothetical protein